MLGKGVLPENQFRHLPRFDPRSNASGYGERGAYEIGELEILAQRTRAQTALGAKFPMKGYHDLLLRTGTVPLAVLGRVIDADIAATLKP